MKVQTSFWTCYVDDFIMMTCNNFAKPKKNISRMESKVKGNFGFIHGLT
jgi:hypothetical protein